MPTRSSPEPTTTSTPTSARAAATTLLVAAAVALAGCTADAGRSDARAGGGSRADGARAGATPPPSNASNHDPCAGRLHDLAGALFLYYFTNGQLPATLEELNTFPGAEQQIPLVCPTSNRPYVYTPDGILLPETQARIVIYDASPAHYGNYRWAIRMEEPRDNQPMVARVIALPESFFVLRPPTQ